MDRRTLGRGSVTLLGLAVATAGLLAAGPAAAAGPAVAAGPAQHVAAEFQRKLADTKWYVIQPEFGGEPEFLYAIAERYLGDGDRYIEIFELNKNRPQADGTALTDPAAVTAGWVLIMPEDAQGDGIQTGPPPTGAPAASSAPATAPAGEPAGGPGGPGGPGSPRRPDPAAPTNTGLILAIVAGVLVLAGAAAGAWWFLRRRKATTKPAEPGRAFDTDAAWTINRALQVMVTSADQAGIAVPSIYGVSIDESRIWLRLAAPDETAPVPWVSLESGRTWQAQLRDLQSLPVNNDLPTPCPRLVTLGTVNGVRELVDLGQATGMIGIHGDAATARELVSSWAAELSGSWWASHVQVVTGDLDPHLAGGERVSTRDALATAEGDGSDAAFTLRGSSSSERKLGVLILGSTPAAKELERAQALVNRPGAAWVVIVVGKTRYDRWQFTVDANGKLDTGALGITVQISRP
ncbi:LysM peptidoglycan-binding domain-containing protein [Actinoplanes couchii]|uniref:Uncharacterized protein n=1 Tax=Actinoplanes couchii TaxID=403638 RepID=A0ABQ3XHM7_9ACTN|nr:hypothetical protein [Actinoplanes couchii]MDR6317627.1 hypothetical protein [Actinoplanes couchii]GID58012.1 hypothetical protein Aco03nite_064160 [Actinoplanes couchii]